MLSHSNTVRNTHPFKTISGNLQPLVHVDSFAHGRQPFQVSYRAPRVAVRTPDSAALCALVNRADPGGCDPSSGSVAEVNLTEVVARLVQGGAR